MEEELAHLQADEELPRAEFAEVQYQENHGRQYWLEREEEVRVPKSKIGLSYCLPEEIQ